MSLIILVIEADSRIESESGTRQRNLKALGIFNFDALPYSKWNELA